MHSFGQRALRRLKFEASFKKLAAFNKSSVLSAFRYTAIFRRSFFAGLKLECDF